MLGWAPVLRDEVDEGDEGLRRKFSVQENTFSYRLYNGIPYSAKFWQGKTLANQSFQSLARENVGKFTIAYISYFSESGI